MPVSVHDRLKMGAAILEALDRGRERTKNPNIHRAVEHKILDRELEQLAREWALNPAFCESKQADKTKSDLRSGQDSPSPADISTPRRGGQSA
jgi:hypothetical protein